MQRTHNRLIDRVIIAMHRRVFPVLCLAWALHALRIWGW